MKKREFTAEYKAKLIIEVLTEQQQLSEIASREGLSRTQLQNWKREFMDNATRVFAQSKLEKSAQKKSAQLLGADWETKTGFKR